METIIAPYIGHDLVDNFWVDTKSSINVDIRVLSVAYDMPWMELWIARGPLCMLVKRFIQNGLHRNIL